VDGERALFLPSSFKNPTKKTFRSRSANLPNSVSPFSVKKEKDLIGKILSDLNANFELNLDTCPSLEHGAVTMD
jgi:hypothetical protein